MAVGQPMLVRRRRSAPVPQAVVRPTRNALQIWSVLVAFPAMVWTLLGVPVLEHVTLPTGVAEDADTTGSLVTLILLGLCVPIMWLRRGQIVRLAVAMWPLLLLCVFFAISSTWALDPATSMRRILRLLITISILISLAVGVGDYRKLHLTIAAAAVVVVLLDAADTVLMPGQAMMDDGLAALHYTKNVAGLSLLYTSISIGFAWPLVRSRWTKACVTVVLLIGCGLLALTRSTTSQALVVVSIGLAPTIYMLSRLEDAPRRAIFAGVGILFLVPLYLYYATNMLTGNDPLAVLHGVTFTERTDIWSFMLDEIAKRPVFGAGYGSFWQIDPAIQPSLKLGNWITTATINEGHDGYLDVIVSVGFAGFAMVMFVLGRTIWLACVWVRRAVLAAGGKRTDGVVVAMFQLCFLIVFCIHNFSESSLFFNSTTFGTLFLLVLIQVEQANLRMKGVRI